MDLSSIPKFFWYCCGISILTATFALTYIAWRSADVSLEIANTKIQLSSAIQDVKQAIATVEATTQPSPTAAPLPTTVPVVMHPRISKDIERARDTLNQAQQSIQRQSKD